MAKYPKYVKGFATLEHDRNTLAGPNPGAAGALVNIYDIVNQGINSGDIDVTGDDLGAVVTLSDAQTITGIKTHSVGIVANGGITAGSSGNIAINTNKFTVAASSGNTVVAGTLGVTGASTLGAATISGVASLSNASITIASLPEYADDTAAGVGGLTAGRLYRTAAGAVMVKLA